MAARPASQCAAATPPPPPPAVRAPQAPLPRLLSLRSASAGKGLEVSRQSSLGSSTSTARSEGQGEDLEEGQEAVRRRRRRKELPVSRSGHVVIAVRIMRDLRPWRRNKGQTPAVPVYLVGAQTEALALNREWLSKEMLTELFLEIERFSRRQRLNKPYPYACCKHERYAPHCLLVTTCVLVVATLLCWARGLGYDMVTPMVFATGFIFILTVSVYICCINKRDLLLGTDPQQACEAFAERWREDRGLPLTFVRSLDGRTLSFFELERPTDPGAEGELGRRGPSEDADEDDGWDKVKTPRVVASDERC